MRLNVDHVFYCNPNNQNAENLPEIPDWTNLVFRELMERIIEQYGAVGFREAFSDFDQDNSNYIDKDEFRAALQRLGFGGEGRPTLTEEEVEYMKGMKAGAGFNIEENPIEMNIIDKARRHAMERLQSGKSPFFDDVLDGGINPKEASNTAPPNIGAMPAR